MLGFVGGFPFGCLAAVFALLMGVYSGSTHVRWDSTSKREEQQLHAAGKYLFIRARLWV